MEVTWQISYNHLNKSKEKRKGGFSLKRKNQEGVKLLLLSLPFVAFVIAFCYVPLFGWAYAFTDYRTGMSLLGSNFVGLKNFTAIWQNRAELIRVMRNTFALSLIGLVFAPLPMVFAILINEIRSTKFKKLVQTFTTLPNFISWIVVFTLAFAMFSSDGMVNNALSKAGLAATVNPLGNNDHAWMFQWALATWKTLGWSAIIYIASIAGIDQELYDAAQVDGANRFQRIMNVTVPGLYPTFFVLLLLQISNILSNGFDQYFIFYNPLTADKLEVLDYYVYKIGVLTNNYPQSIALGMFKTVISVVLLFGANKFSKRRIYYLREEEKNMTKKNLPESTHIKRSIGNKVADVIIYIILALFMIMCIYPFYYVIIYSISDPNKAASGLFLLPKGFSLNTFKGILLLNDIPLAMLVSVGRSIIGAVLTIVGSSFFAYLVTNEHMIGRKVIYRIAVLTMYLNAGLIPWYMTMKTYHLQNNFLLYVLPGFVTAYYVILIKTYIESLPRELEESAMIDGAGILTRYSRIVMPLSKPIIATIGVYAIVGQWNAWTDNYFLVTDAKLQTLQMILYNYLNQANRFQQMSSSAMDASAAASMITPTSVKMCITVIVVVPIMCVYPFLQRYFVKGIMMGAVKG